MSNSGEIQIISDGDGMAVMGKPELVAAFLADVEVGESADIPKGRMSSLLSSLAAESEAASAVAENSGKWLKLDDASAQALKKYGQSFSEKNGLMYGVVRGKGQIAKHLQFVPSASSLISPAMLTRSNEAASGLVMAQKALGISTEVRALEGQGWWGAVRGVRDDTVDAAKQRADDIRAFGERVSEDVTERRIERAEKKLERLRGSREESVDTDGI